MKICGLNESNQLGEESNTINKGDSPCISPPCDSHLDISSLLSYFIFSEHSVNITKENRAFAIGNNEGFRIIQTLPEEVIDHETEIIIQDTERNPFKFISAVCGSYYTLYLLSSEESKINQLLYVYKTSGITTPLFLNLNGHNPQYLFGGEKISSTIDSDGNIFIITNSVFISHQKTVKPSILPNDEKAICVACCNSFVFVLSLSGHVFVSSVKFNDFSFTLVKELEKEGEIIEISGTCDHCFAVCKDGRVFAFGLNSEGRLGIGGEEFKATKFVEVSSLNKYKIVSASAGCNHSLFITSNGKVLACGSNYYNQLLFDNDLKKEFFCFPVETKIQKDATFCIAGKYLSAVFVGCRPPKSTPNQVIGLVQTKNEDEIEADKDRLIEKLKKQNKMLHQQNIKNENEIAILVNEISSLTIRNQKYQENEENAKKEFLQYKGKLEKLKRYIDNHQNEDNTSKDKKDDENILLKKEIDKLKDEILKKDEENESFNKKIDKLKDEIHKKDDENESFKTEIDELKDEIHKKDEEIDSLKKELDELKEQNDKNNSANIELIKLKQELNELKNQMNKKEVQNKDIQLLNASTIDSFEKINKIGKGSSSEVYEILIKEQYALKLLDFEICNKSSVDDDDEDDSVEKQIDIEKMRKFFCEYEAINQLNHPNIIKAYGFYFGDSKHQPSILLEYCPYNLKKRIKKLQDFERKTAIIEICSAMKAVHNAGFIHRDLKLENILLDKNNRIKLCDFGLCTLIEKDTNSTSRTQMAGTLCFMAPELIQGRTDYDEKVDVYSFGVVIYLILSKGEYPNIGLLDVGAGKMAEIPEGFTDFSKELIKKCWSFKASERPSFMELDKIINDNKDKII